MSDALSILTNSAGNAPKLLWHTVFGTGVTLGTPLHVNDTLWRTTLSGTDSVTGFNFTSDLESFLSTGTTAKIESIPDYNVPDTTEYALQGSEAFEAIVNYPWRSDGRQLVNKIIKKGPSASPNPQRLLQIERPSSASVIANPLEEFYLCVDFIIPSGTTTQTGDTATGNFLLPGVFEIKSGCHYNGSVYQNSVGDFRINTQISGADGVDKWRVLIDNQANGGYTNTAYYDNKSSGVPILYDTPLRHHLHVKRPTSNSDIYSGRITIGIQAYGAPIKILADIQGGVQKGVENLPFTRFMINLYGSVLAPMEARCGQIQFWDRPPIVLV